MAPMPMIEITSQSRYCAQQGRIRSTGVQCGGQYTAAASKSKGPANIQPAVFRRKCPGTV